MKRAGWLVGCVGLLIVFLTAPGGAQPPRPPAPPTVHHPDLVVSSFTVNRGRVATGETFTYTIDVKNRGDAPCAAFSLTVTLPRGIASAGPLQGAAPLSCRGLTCKWGGDPTTPTRHDCLGVGHSQGAGGCWDPDGCEGHRGVVQQHHVSRDQRGEQCDGRAGGDGLRAGRPRDHAVDVPGDGRLRR